MRQTIQINQPLAKPYSCHKHAELYQTISNILRLNPIITELVLKDLTKKIAKLFVLTGRTGLSADQVLRAAIIKQIENFSYEELAFHLSDSDTFRTFSGFGWVFSTPSASTLHENISKISPETWSDINSVILKHAKNLGIENGKVVRGDTTVVESKILKPCDSKLLLDCVTVLVRIMDRASQLLDGRFVFNNHTRLAKRRYMAILNSKKEPMKLKAYRDLINVTQKTLRQADHLLKELMRFSTENPDNCFVPHVEKFLEQLAHYCDLTERVISQTVRRVLNNESVPSAEKVVSIFEDHADIIVKDNRETFFGHKIDLFSGKSGLILVCEVLEGNPADSTLVVQMLNDLNEIYGYFPDKVAFDGGFTSKDNVQAAKALGVKECAFSKRKGMTKKDMCTSDWIYNKLRDFRAGIEAVISRLKRCFGLSVCDWKGAMNFTKYVWCSVVSYNLVVFAKRLT